MKKVLRNGIVYYVFGNAEPKVLGIRVVEHEKLLIPVANLFTAMVQSGQGVIISKQMQQWLNTNGSPYSSNFGAFYYSRKAASHRYSLHNYAMIDGHKKWFTCWHGTFDDPFFGIDYYKWEDKVLLGFGWYGGYTSYGRGNGYQRKGFY